MIAILLLFFLVLIHPFRGDIDQEGFIRNRGFALFRLRSCRVHRFYGTNKGVLFRLACRMALGF